MLLFLNIISTEVVMSHIHQRWISSLFSSATPYARLTLSVVLCSLGGALSAAEVEYPTAITASDSVRISGTAPATVGTIKPLSAAALFALMD
jgi:hypothetical protein